MDLKYVCGNFRARVILAGRRFLISGLVAGLAGCSGGGDNNNVEQFPTQPVAIDVLSALVTPAYTLDDSGGGPAAFPPSEYSDGNFVVRSTAETSDSAFLGSSHDASPLAVRVVQGSYDVLYQHETGDGVPQNVGATVQTGEIISANKALPIAVTAWTVTPAFTHNMAAFPVTEYDDGNFYLKPTAGGENIFLGNSHTAMPAGVRVVEGIYDVIYSLETGGDQVPNNQAAVVVPGVNIGADINPFAVDLASVRFQLNATLDTAAFPVSQYQKAVFFLRNTTTGDRVNLGASYELPVTMYVADGSYDIVYQHVRGDQLPVNADAIIASGVLIGSGGVSSVSIDVESVAVTPSFMLDGGAFPQSEYNDANFYLRGTNNNDDVMFLGASEILPVAVRVISSDFDTDVGAGVLELGAYDVLYRHETGESVPQNTNAVVRSNVTVNSDVSLFAVSVSSVNVAARFSLNGNSFPNNASNSVRFLLRDSSNDSDEFLFGFSDISNEAVKLIPGTYHVIMDHLSGNAVPQNEMHEIDFSNVLNQNNVTLSVNVPAVRVDPSFTLDGQAFPASIYQSARFYLRERHSPKNRIFLGESYKNNNPVMVIKEDYDVVYEHLSGEQMPQNTDKFLEVVDL